MTRRVLVPEPSNSHQRNILRGIYAFSLANQGWSIHRISNERRWHEAITQPFDGAIVDGSVALAETLARTGRPLVSTSNTQERIVCPCVDSNDEMAGALAARHLIERGYRQLVYAGPFGLYYSERRGEGFTDEVKRQGMRGTMRNPFGPGGIEAFVAWLRNLPGPTGVVCPDDNTALNLLQKLTIAGVTVPEEIAVVGVDNDDLACTLFNPELTSVQLDGKTIGRLAAKRLQQAMNGEPPPHVRENIDPLGIVVRASSDTIASEDPDVRHALNLIRDQAFGNLDVPKLLNSLSISRRVLERKFKQETGHTLLEYIVETRVNRAKQLMVNTDLPLSRVAVLSGFNSAARFSAVFRDKTGFTPSGFRDAHARGVLQPWYSG